MKKIFITCLVFSLVISVCAQDRSIGLRAGAPMGITYKKYLPQHKAVEFILGASPAGWYDQYYDNAFKHYNRYENYSYVSHGVRSTIYFQGRYLLQNDIHIEGMIGKLQWYWGIGGMLKLASVEYRYRDTADGILKKDVHTDIDFGPEGIAGMEYTFEDVPITLFGEFSLLVELADRPGALRGFSGVGGRYRF